MNFHSKPEALSYALIKLTEFDKKYKDAKEITHCVEYLKIAFENHEQDLEAISQYLDIIKFLLDKDDLKKLIKLQTALKTSHYQQSPKEKFENPLARRSESELFILLLYSPTKAMMDAVKRMSIEILKALDYLRKNNTESIQDFLSNLEESAHVISCGGFKKTPTLDHVVTLLTNNDEKTFTELLFIHFKFGQAISRKVPIKNAPNRTPVGKLPEVIQEIWPGKPEDFFKDAISQDSKDGERYRSYIADEKIYACTLYTAEKSRGRLGLMRKRYTNQFGLMLPSQQRFSKDFPRHSSRWVPDCIGQEPDLSSPYVKDAIDNDAVYVSGPSGMASVLLGQMEFMGNFEDVKIKQNYLSAVTAYIVGGGFHSLHEVIGPAEFCLNLVPGYNIAIPQQGKLAAPAKYHTYFAQQAKIDPEFNERREVAWQNYLSFFQHVYLTNIKPIKQTQPHLLEVKKINDPLYQSIIHELDRYIQSRGHISHNKVGLTLKSRLFRNTQLTQEKIKNAMLLKELVNNIFHTTHPENRSEKLFHLMFDFKELDDTVEKEFNKSYSCCTKSGFTYCLKNIEKLIHNNSKISYPFSY